MLSRVSFVPIVAATLTVCGVIVVIVYFVWPQSNSVKKDVSLVGNFTILDKTISDVNDSSICEYLTTILSISRLTAINCIICDLRPGSVKVKFLLIIDNAAMKSEDVVLHEASSGVARNSVETSVFFIDQSSMTFDDKNGVVQRTCFGSSLCSGFNVVCISVIGGHECVCKTGYARESSSGNCFNGLTTPAAGSRYCMPTSTWIPQNEICDKYQDCPDDTDEVNCTCDTSYQYACANGRCIYKEWLCDGVSDCPRGDDESFPECIECRANEFRCEKPWVCIAANEQCNGCQDCTDSSDESHCLNFNETEATADGIETQLLTAIFQGIPGYHICSDIWNSTWSDRTCQYLGYGKAAATSFQSLIGTFLAVDPEVSSSNFMAFFHISNCSSQSAISISCQNAECGRRSVLSESVGPYILNGQRAIRGAWPWQVVVYTGYLISKVAFQPMFICGGILLNDRWILTAAHCTVISQYDPNLGNPGTTRPENILVLLGTISLNDNPDMLPLGADLVFTHPLYDPVAIDNDVGLIRLSRPVKFKDTIKPICLPAAEQDLDRLVVCVNTGFGNTLRNTISDHLLQAKMNIIPVKECLRLNKFFRNNTQICIGTIPTPGNINICSGDSGGPLSCQDQSGAWMVIGVNSYGLGTGAKNDPAVDICQLSVVARVTAFLNWIESTIAAYSV